MLNIAIDGPSGAGKSTVAKILAQKLNILYLDTGAMYRAIGLKAYRLGIDPNDERKVQSFLSDTKVEVEYNSGEQRIFLDGEDVSKDIRMHEMSRYASDISKHKSVRLKLVALQREIASNQPMILDGRDICSYVLKDSKNKFYLTASAEIRADRRYKELVGKGQTISRHQVLYDIIQRDKNDSTREFAPLVKTDDATEIISDSLTAQQVAELIISKLKY